MSIGKTPPDGTDLVSRNWLVLEEGLRHLLRAISVCHLILLSMPVFLSHDCLSFCLLSFTPGDQCPQRSHTALQWQILATAASATRSMLETGKDKRDTGSQRCVAGKVSDGNGGGLYYLLLPESLFSCSNAFLQELVKANTNGLCDATGAYSGVRACTQENYSLLVT